MQLELCNSILVCLKVEDFEKYHLTRSQMHHLLLKFGLKICTMLNFVFEFCSVKKLSDTLQLASTIGNMHIMQNKQIV